MGLKSVGIAKPHYPRGTLALNLCLSLETSCRIQARAFTETSSSLELEFSSRSAITDFEPNVGVFNGRSGQKNELQGKPSNKLGKGNLNVGRRTEFSTERTVGNVKDVVQLLETLFLGL